MTSYTDEQVLEHAQWQQGATKKIILALLADRTRLQAALDAVSKVAMDLETDAEIVQARNQKLSNTLKVCAREIRLAINSARAKKENMSA